ncbi:hypothetical protein HDV00_010106, partial [Rhizophlyctis rosea]
AQKEATEELCALLLEEAEKKPAKICLRSASWLKPGAVATFAQVTYKGDGPRMGKQVYIIKAQDSKNICGTCLHLPGFAKRDKLSDFKSIDDVSTTRPNGFSANSMVMILEDFVDKIRNVAKNDLAPPKERPVPPPPDTSRPITTRLQAKKEKKEKEEGK